MEILVLMKQVPDLNVWVEIDHKKSQADPDDMISILNPCDLVSLSLSVKLIQRLGAGRVTSLLLGPKRARKLLKKCLDYGASRAIHVQYEDINKLESLQIAFILKEIIRKMNLPYDLILTGHDYSEAGFATGQIGTQIGAYLGLPQASQVTCIKPSQVNNELILDCCLDFGDRISLKCSPPLLLTSYPDIGLISYPSFRMSLESLNISVECVKLSDLDLDPSTIKKRTSLISVSVKRPRPKKVFIPDSTLSAAERMRLIMRGGRDEKQSDLLEGNPRDLAKHILDFLLQKRIINPDS